MTQSFLLINCFNKSNDVKEKLSEISNVREVQSVNGTYDYIMKTDNLPKTEIRKMIRNKIRPIKEVRSTLALDKYLKTRNLVKNINS